jgi:Zn-dependent peptidase ImmA (M78 family)
MRKSKRELAQEALYKAGELRKKFKIPPMSPVPIYEICKDLDLTVRFVNVSSMEGMYVHGEKNILISSRRPLTRKHYTCGHELGHHVFDHGYKVDELLEAGQKDDPQEFLVDCFAGFLLMPKLALKNAFNIRGWSPELATPRQIFTISCNFNVGYETIINHMNHAVKMISSQRASELKRLTPKSIRQELMGGDSDTSLVIADEQWISQTIDVEVGCQILVPKTTEIDIQPDIASIVENSSVCGKIVRAEKPGIIRAFCPDSNWAVFIRISRLNYEGLSEYRHLEDCDNE